MRKFEQPKIGSQGARPGSEGCCEPVWATDLNLIKARAAIVLPLCNLQIISIKDLSVRCQYSGVRALLVIKKSEIYLKLLSVLGLQGQCEALRAKD
jgi:hypothetical protein